MSNDEYQQQKYWEGFLRFVKEAKKNQPYEFQLIMSYEQMKEFEKLFKQENNKNNGK